MFKKDNFAQGLAIGATLPILTFVLIEFLKTQMEVFARDKFIYIICVGANVLILRYFIKKEFDQTAKGILMVTFIYALLFFYKFFKV